MGKIDILYSTLLGYGVSNGFVDIEKNMFCDAGSMAYGIVVLLLCYAITVVKEVLVCIPDKTEDSKNLPSCFDKHFPEIKEICSVMWCTAIFILLVFYTLADNHLPLEYALCMYINKTVFPDEYASTKHMVFETRAGMSWISCAFVSLIFVVAICSRSYSKANQNRSSRKRMQSSV